MTWLVSSPLLIRLKGTGHPAGVHYHLFAMIASLAAGNLFTAFHVGVMVGLVPALCLYLFLSGRPALGLLMVMFMSVVTCCGFDWVATVAWAIADADTRALAVQEHGPDWLTHMRLIRWAGLLT
ncbi:MAG: hypothetical protein MI861_03620, partial [Pirellulales bacterium]|nr:hypothetical protein [Pirellulales bacterium]